ncbi:MAG: hypothetical protein J6K23_04555 [Bacilli bacterium]|nr:hypothetical protein [Bacilli bacterium]
MHTDVACLTESSKFFDDSYNELGNCINLLNNAINDASLVSDGSFGERLSTVKNNLSTINNELDTIIGYINKTIGLLNTFNDTNESFDLSLFALDIYNDNDYLYLLNNIISSDNLSNTKKINPDAEKNILYIYSYMRNNLGYTHDGAMAMINNMGAESAFNPTAKNDSSGAFGLCQWLDRKQKLVNFANEHHLDVNDIDTQLLFMDYELKTDYNNGDKQHHLYDQVTGKIDVDAKSLSGNITKIYQVPVDSREENYYEKMQTVSNNRYNSYNDVIEDFLDANNIFKRTKSNEISGNYNDFNTSNVNETQINNNVTNEVTSDNNSNQSSGIEVLDVNSSSNNTSGMTNSNTYEIKEGDSLYSVFGDKWRDVYNANKDKISDPNFIEVGLVLNIPDGIEIK